MRANARVDGCRALCVEALNALNPKSKETQEGMYR